MTKGLRTAVAEIPDEQRFTWQLTPMPGRLLDAEMVGRSLADVCKLLRLADKTERRVFSALTAIRLKDGVFEAEIALLPIVRKKAPTLPNSTDD